jgi:serine protease Do
VRAVLESTGAGQRLVRPWLGARGRTITVHMANGLGLPRVSGVLIDDVAPGGPSAAAGLAAGDVVQSIDGRSIDDTEAMQFRVDTMPIGGSAKFVVWRQGAQRELTVKLMAPPETPRREVTQLRAGPLAGVTVANLSPELADELETSESSGIIVLDVPRNCAAAKARLAVGDILATVNGQPVATVADLQGVSLRSDAAGKVGLLRNGRSMLLTVQP